MSDTFSVGIAKLSLQPGDVLVVAVPDSYDWRDAIGGLRAFLPISVHILVKYPNCDLYVLRAGQPVAPDVDPATVVEVPHAPDPR